MKSNSKIKKAEGTARQFDISVPKETVDKVFDQVLKEFCRKADIPGFRKGKAPEDMVRRKHNDAMLDEAKKRLVPIGYQQALREHGVIPVSYPELYDVEMLAEGSLVFKAKVDACPEISLKKYKGLKLVRNRVKVSDKEAEETLTHLRNINAEFINIDGSLKKGDFGVCDVETFIEGKLISRKRENLWIEADKENSMFGVGEKLCGLKKGDYKEIDVELPLNYEDNQFAGKQAVFKIEVKETKEKKLPELDDDFAKKLGRDTMEDARQEIKTQLLERKEYEQKMEQRNQIVNLLLKKYSFDLPESMVKRQLKILMERAENKLAKKGVEKSVIDENKDKLLDNLRKEAENKVKVYFILDEIAACEKIEVSDEEVKSWLASLAASYNQPLDKVKHYYEENKLISGVKEQLREEKTLDYLIAEAAVSEKDGKK